MKKFCEFAKEEIGLSGDKINISELFNKEIEIIDFRLMNSKHNNKRLLQLQIKYNNDTRVTFTNSEVLIKQCESYKSEMPFIATIRKVSSYYTFS